MNRRVLSLEEVVAIARKLREPYSTLVLFLAVTGCRIGEAIAIKWSDFDGGILHVQRRIYEGEVDTAKTEESEREIPVPEVLLERMRALGDGEWVFRARVGSPLNPERLEALWAASC